MKSIVGDGFDSIQFSSDVPAHSFVEGWNQVLSKSKNQPFEYIFSEIEYQRKYLLGSGKAIKNHSVVFLQDRTPVAILPIIVEQTECGSSKIIGPQLAPLFSSDVSAKSERNIVRALLDTLTPRLKSEKDGAFLELARSSGSLSYFSQELAARSTKRELRLYQGVSLKRPLGQIIRRYRKSYRSLIKDGKYFDVKVVRGSEIEPEFRRFRDLHFQSAGRLTRGVDTWLHQAEQLHAEDMLLCVAYEKGSDVLVGGALFLCSRDEMYYHVAAYDRGRFDSPVGHPIIHAAITYAQQSGMQRFIIGSLDNGDSEMSEKLSRIYHFKNGFQTDLYCGVLWTV